MRVARVGLLALRIAGTGPGAQGTLRGREKVVILISFKTVRKK